MSHRYPWFTVYLAALPALKRGAANPRDHHRVAIHHHLAAVTPDDGARMRMTPRHGVYAARLSRLKPVARIVSRILAAAVGGYAISVVAGVVFGHGLSATHSDAVLAGMLLSFIVYTAAIVWAFAARSPSRAWMGILLPTAILAGPALWIAAGNGS